MTAPLKSWEVKKFRQVTVLALQPDFSVQLTNQYSDRNISVEELMKEWFGFEENKSKEITIIIELLSLVPLERMGKHTVRIAKFYASYPDPQNWTDNELRPDQLFFYGPRKHSLSLNERKKIRAEIHSKVAQNFQLTDGFLLFNYDEIQYSKEVRNDSDGEDYFKIKNGKVTYGGYDGANNGGSQDWDLESVYYWHEESFNLFTNHRFKRTQKEVKEIMDKHIIKE
ncbi:MAG: hypothetical protein IPM77_02635 [Crocinitomicaceae bacterium]|nr:hypothetical protein [Crocinitomicaceae bacterium]